MKKFYSLLLCIGISFSSFAQQLTPTFTPGSGTVKLDWQHAGFPGDTVPSYPDIVNIMTYGANNTGATSTNTAFTNAVNSLNGANGVIYFPPGNYLFTATLFLRGGLILRGAGSGSTTLTFNLPGEGDLIRVTGTAGASTPITAAVQQYGNQVTVTNPAIASMGNFVKIYQSNEGNLLNDTWADNVIGQFSQLKSKSGNTFTFYTRHRRGIPLNGAPMAQVINMKTGVGIECLKLKRMDVDLVANQTSNIFFQYAAYCWVKGVDSDSCNFAHISIMHSSNIEVTGSYFHGAFAYGGGGSAYGVVCHMSAGDCLIENNIFRNLRHAMLMQAGCNGNVYAYNYSIQPKRTEIPNDAAQDIVLHGNYPYANLVEGNIAQNIGGDASHGKNGPANVYFRNRAQRYGITFTSPSSDSSVVIYNEVTGTGGFLGQLSTTGSNTIASRNYKASSGGFVGNMETRFSPNVATTFVHFLEPTRPYYFTADLQPIGYPGPYNPAISIPARDRYVAGGTMTYCSNKSRKDSIMPVACNPMSLAANKGYVVHDIAETNEFRDNSNCGMIAGILPSGNSPVNGVIVTKTTIDPTVPVYGNKAFVQRHYDIEPVSNPSTSTARLTLYFTQQEFNAYNAANGLDADLPTGPTDAIGKSNLIVNQYHGTGTIPGSYSGALEIINPGDENILWDVATSRWQVSFDVSGFSGFFVSGASNPLPVKLVSFNYYVQDKEKVLLKWEVAEQVDIWKYIVERSSNGRDYSPIGSVTANRETSYTYGLTDNDPVDGLNYYRLQIVEDNVKNYSRILVVNLVARKNALAIYPVPATNVFTIRLTNSELINTDAQLLSADGRLLRRIKLHNQQQDISISSLTKGVYYLKTFDGSVYKILKQ